MPLPSRSPLKKHMLMKLLWFKIGREIGEAKYSKNEISWSEIKGRIEKEGSTGEEKCRRQNSGALIIIF